MKGMMNKKHRKNILLEANKLMKAENTNYDSMATGEKEVLQDVYINKVCKSLGWDIHTFYATDGKELNKLLNI